MGYRKVVRGFPSVERLQEALRFDLAAGKAFWIERAPKRKFGGEAGYDRKGYRHLTVDGHSFALHRAMWAVANGHWPDAFVDHRDGNPLNNRIDNLRLASPVENSINKKMQRNNTSGFKGVHLHANGQWRARIARGGKHYCLGLHSTPEAAAAAYEEAASRIHGDFARAK